MNLTSNNNGTYINDTIVPNVTNSTNLNQATINMKIVNKKVQLLQVYIAR